MNKGKAFEIFVRQILINVGFSEIESDGLYVFNGTAGQMLQGLGDAHNADVLLEPPVQTPFYSLTRLLIECKYYKNNVGLNIIRSALGLREDVNNFDIVDLDELNYRRRLNRNGLAHSHTRYLYQVAVASMKGFTVPAQNFAATHRIPIIQFDNMPFWNDFCELINFSYRQNCYDANGTQNNSLITRINEEDVIDFANIIGSKMAVAITNSGQMLFLYRINGSENKFSDYYSLHWNNTTEPWQLVSGDNIYVFQLPEAIMNEWLTNSVNEIQLKKAAINCKANVFNNMVVYYKEHCMPKIKMISINQYELELAKTNLNG